MFNKELILQPNTVVHCETEEQANELLVWADSIGLMWGLGTRYINNNRYNYYLENTCYNLKLNAWSYYEFYKEEGYKILSFNEAKGETMEVGSKWVKDGEVIEVIFIGETSIIEQNGLKMFLPVCVCYKDKNEKLHVLTEADFLEQYKPYEPVYEAFYSYGNIDTTKQTKKRYKDDNEFLQSDECYGISFQGFQRLDFTKKERRC